MKTKLLILLTSISSLLSYAQLTKAETYIIGTKIGFYPNQCGNIIPEATGKLSFCDSNNNLAVVEKSFGLNDRGVERMLPNYFNEDEVYVTGKGLSIRNTDGTWENVPNIAMPESSTQYERNTPIRNGLVLPDGKIIIQATNTGVNFQVYDRVLKTLTPVNFPDNKYPYLFAYDSVRGLTWILTQNGSNRYLFTYDGSSLSEIANVTSGIATNIAVLSVNFVYHDNSLYVGSSNGLYKIDVNTLIITQYNSSTTPSLPFDSVGDLKFDSNENLWLAHYGGSADGGIVKFDVINETYELYQLETENNPNINHTFENLAIDESGMIWATAINYLGLIKLTFPGDVATFETIPRLDFNTLGVPWIYVPNNIYYRNNKFYFTTVDILSSPNFNYEVLINENGSWSGRNDDELGNISTSMNWGFNEALPDDNGNVWWFGTTDIIIKRDENDNHQTLVLENLGQNAAIDSDQNAVVKGGNPNELRKVNFPNATSIQGAPNSAVQIQQYKDEIWVYDNNLKKIDVYKNDALVDTYNLDENDYQNITKMAIDDTGDAWFSRYIGTNDLVIKKFNTVLGTTTTFNRLENISTIKKVIVAPNNGVWFIGQLGAIYYNGTNFYPFLAADYNEIYNLVNAVVDINGKIYLLNNDSASITTIENPESVTPILTETKLENTNAILPALDQYKPSTIVIDNNGSVWTHASLNTFKLIDNDFATQYKVQETLSVNQLDYLQANINVYPNPTLETIYIKSSIPISELSIFDLLGKEMVKNKNSQQINLSGLSRGIYILQVKANNKVTSKKIILQ
ncbi:Por secretion system C-terminal sorting domain-containing protein [Flaviramulus basaltis]|uniref:Por secretion system C-terminal sorting domain-containing protein n=1 Tax=Flaviramulus basaltis TaxID=369401 RepID=A0A1K2IMK4_9FLAO|nr:T9SS type A sorting domain-containing protein [Flaviramulus basaltis]SFZ93432.1 Por secretion system C-terminal sorting domain-containing protein [Flaviramulus basaltis]